jgi:hypothetical protein
MMIMDHASGDSDRAHLAVDVIVRLRELLLECGGEGDDFERRTGFVNILQRPVRSRFRFRFGTLFGSNVGAFASARISPLRGSSTITFPTSRASVARRLVELVRPDTESI